MDPALAQTLVAAILEKAPVPLSSTYKTSPYPNTAFGCKAKLNRSGYQNDAQQSLRDIAKALDSQREGDSPTKSTPHLNFIKKNKEEL